MRGSTISKPEALRRQMGPVGVWLVVINGIIGAGIFGLGAGAARLAGEFSPWIFVLCAVLMLPIKLSFSSLASRFESTGGPVHYVGSAFGPFLGFQAGWAFWVARLTSFSANISLLVAALAYFWPAAEQGIWRVLLLFLITAALTVNNILGARDAIRSLAILTVLKFVPLLVLVVIGLVMLPAGDLLPSTQIPPDADLGAAALLVFYAFVGFESGLVPAGEAKNPQRDIPRALLWALLVSGVLYALLQTISMAALPGLATTTRPLVEVAAELIGEPGAYLLMFGILASVGGNLAGAMFSTPRVTYALARDGSLPAWYGEVHPRFGTPSNSILFYGLASFLLAAAGSFVWLAGLSVLTRILLYLACIGAMPTLAKEQAASPAKVRLPGGWTIPLLAVGVCLWLLTHVSLNAWLVTAAFLALGSVLYLLSRSFAKS